MDREGRQELHYRAIEGDISGIRDRLVAGDDVTLADRQGFTALHFAAQQSQADAVKTLLEAGAPVDPQDRYGNTPLWRAVFDSRGRGETIQALLAGGANPDLPVECLRPGEAGVQVEQAAGLGCGERDHVTPGFICYER